LPVCDKPLYWLHAVASSGSPARGAQQQAEHGPSPAISLSAPHHVTLGFGSVRSERRISLTCTSVKVELASSCDSAGIAPASARLNSTAVRSDATTVRSCSTVMRAPTPSPA